MIFCIPLVKQKEAKNSTKNELDKIEIKGDVVLKQNLQMEVDENQECIKKIAGQENANLHIPEDVVHNHITPQKNSAPFPKPLLLHDSLHISQTSYTAHMKEAMNVVQEMWSSPTPPGNRSCTHWVHVFLMLFQTNIGYILISQLLFFVHVY